MSIVDTTPPKLTPDPADAPESKNQFVVALSIVTGLVVLGLGMIIAALCNPTVGTAIGIGTALGTILGILGNALNTPSGIGKVLNAAKQIPQAKVPPLGE